uniref:Uncharacterized protein n=1 Tax=Spongospora subterranea TaxID=70186 RepID=A0A0H5R103_9EUKA|eukprot:CRZ07892.1 hypothetical protein [Spongospora subterranea]
MSNWSLICYWPTTLPLFVLKNYVLSKIPPLNGSNDRINWTRKVIVAFDANELDSHLVNKPDPQFKEDVKKDKIARGFLMSSIRFVYSDGGLEKKTTCRCID